MKKNIYILSSLLLMTAVKAQTVVVKKERVNPSSSQITSIFTSSKEPKTAPVDYKKGEADKAAVARAAKNVNIH